MLTTSEITDKRKARRDLDNKRVALEEAVERGVCERVYPRLWRYRSTDDEARDEKLRSRAAALSLVGVDLHELLSTALSHSDATNAPELHQVRDEKSESARYKLTDARASLEQMNSDRHPFGKLQHLTAAHKGIVEVLSQMFPSTSSADEVLPTLIYAIITSDPEKMHFVSNLNFISRFRASSKIDGEAAYCITNLEAAISFLENPQVGLQRLAEKHRIQCIAVCLTSRILLALVLVLQNLPLSIGDKAACVPNLSSLVQTPCVTEQTLLLIPFTVR